MDISQSYREGRKLALPFCLFSFHQVVSAKEECQTAYDGIIECETGCCGEHWRNNVSCCPFHPSAFIMIVLGVMLIIVFIAYCIVSSMKRCNRSKTIIKPHVPAEENQDVSLVSYYVVAPGIREKGQLSTNSDDQDWKYYYITYPQKPNYLSE
ncbi:uncharacterized protein [Argopecten irradians]|uniref:uncharacterized protein n=1 Tax=Argopecten irradians TaxID=31199 RepID=UPI00371D292F